jgi:hypothetical protein
MEKVIVGAIAGPAAIEQLLFDFVYAARGTTVEMRIGQLGETMLVLMRVGSGPNVALSVDEARHVARHCFASDMMTPIMRDAVGGALADLARHLIDAADTAEAQQPQRLH